MTPRVRRPYPWGEMDPTPELATYDQSRRLYPTPVGCYPAGAAACGALDMAGNVWEWMSSSYNGYPGQSLFPQPDFVVRDYDVPLRGGSYSCDGLNIRCDSRFPIHTVELDLIIAGAFVCASPIATCNRQQLFALFDHDYGAIMVTGSYASEKITFCCSKATSRVLYFP